MASTLIRVCFLFLFTPLLADYTYELAATAIFRNEGRFLKEWIEYHRIVGVQHFYLVNNLSTDNYQEVLAPYIAEGIVELLDCPYESSAISGWGQIQNTSYNCTLKKAKGVAKWVAILDMDEYVVPKSTDSLQELLKEYEPYGGLAVNWQLFGTSGVYEVQPNQLMTEMLIRRTTVEWEENQIIKSIVRPERVKFCNDPHGMDYHKGYFCVNSNHKTTLGSRQRVVVDKVQINHYWSKDEKFFWEEKVGRRASWGEGYDGIIGRRDRCNKEEDTAILRFIPELRKRMGLS